MKKTIKPFKKPNAGIAKLVKSRTGGKRVMRGTKAPMDKHGVKPNIPLMNEAAK